MDYNAPVAKRTRLKEALFYEELHKKLRKGKSRTGNDIKIEGEEGQDTDWMKNGDETDSLIECYESESQEEVVISDELEVIDSSGSVVSKYGDKPNEETVIPENCKASVTIKIEDTDEEDAGAKCNDSMQSSCSALGVRSDVVDINAGKAPVEAVSSTVGEADISLSKKSSDELDETQSKSSRDNGDSEEGFLRSDDSEYSTEEESFDDYLINISSSSSVSDSEEEEADDEDEEDEEDIRACVENGSKQKTGRSQNDINREEVEDIRMKTSASVENKSKQKRAKSQNDIDKEHDQLRKERCKRSKCASIARRTRSHVNQFFKKTTVKVRTYTSPISIDDVQDHLPAKNLHRSMSVDHDCFKNKNPTVANTIKPKKDQQQQECNIDKPCHHNHTKNRNPSVQDRIKQKLEEDFNDEQEKGCGCNKSDDHDGIFSSTPTSGNKIRNRKVKTRKEFNILDVLVDSIWDKGDTFLDEFAGTRTDLPNSEELLPLKFTFGIKKPVPPEKTDYEKELDELWAELNFSLTSFNVGTSSLEEAKDEIKTDADPTTPCCQGKHNLVLDEQIGVKCKHCSVVWQEIRYILPTFYKYPMGKSGSKERGMDGAFAIDGVMLEDMHTSKRKPDDSLLLKDSVWDIIPGIYSTMYPHQRAGFEFIWKNVAGGTSLTKIKDKDSTATEGCSGCIISHAPGTGKTRLTIVFLQTYMKLFPSCRPVIIAPCSMLLTWEEELQKWNVDIPFHNLNTREFSGKENVVALNFLLQSKVSSRTKNSIRLVKLYSWKKDTSILLLSYRLFEKLAGEDGKSHRNNRKCEMEEKLRRSLLEIPEILVLDEGHTPRNEQSNIWKALSNIETEKRIILSGTPFQNNFGELFNTLCLVRPKFADRFFPWNENFIKKRGRKCKSAKSNWASLTRSIENDEKLIELKDILSPFVHVHTGTILKDSLPGLRDCIIVLLPTPLQRTLLQKVEAMKNKNKLEISHIVSVISVHPSLFRDEGASECANIDTLRLQPDAGVKSQFVIELIRLSEALKEKVLVFSQYLDPLTCISDQLKSLFNWTQGNEVLYMDGGLGTKQRQSSIASFNQRDSNVRVLLASIRACCEGINLVGASRVVLLDVVWNPSVERQAISRAYRLGQMNMVYIYHLITSGTMEGEKYYRQAEKDRLSELVFSSTASDAEKLKVCSSVCDDRILDEMLRHEKLKCMFEKIIYQPKEANLIESFGLVDS